MTRQETIRAIIDSLKRRRKELLKKLKSSTSRHVSDEVGESRSVSKSLESKLFLAEADPQEVRRIDEALLRYCRRKFGVCRACDRQIPVARLRAIPHAERCVSCQEKVDSGEAEEEAPKYVATDLGLFLEVMSIHD